MEITKISTKINEMKKEKEKKTMVPRKKSIKLANLWKTDKGKKEKKRKLPISGMKRDIGTCRYQKGKGILPTTLHT